MHVMMMKSHICPYCDGPYTLADGGCRAHCPDSIRHHDLITAALDDPETEFDEWEERSCTDPSCTDPSQS